MAGLVVGGNFLSLGTRIGWSKAYADGPAGLTSWPACGGVDYVPDSDTSGAYQSWQPACNGGDYRSSVYCDANGWHRRDTVTIDPNTYVDYDAVTTRCWGGSASRNAWHWDASKDPGGTKKTFRCSDGNMIIHDTGGAHTYHTVCRGML
jgi:hypothetical protein